MDKILGYLNILADRVSLKFRGEKCYRYCSVSNELFSSQIYLGLEDENLTDQLAIGMIKEVSELMKRLNAETDRLLSYARLMHILMVKFDEQYQFRSTIAFIQASLALEGNSYTVDELKTTLTGWTVANKRLHEFYEVINYRELLSFLESKRSGINTRNIKHIHSILHKNIAETKFRSKEEKGRVAVDAIKTDFEHLCRWYRSIREVTLMDIAEFHRQMHLISPFSTGNTKLARELLRLQLLDQGYPLFLFDDQNEERYQRALKSNDSEPLSRLFIDLIIFRLRDLKQDFKPILRDLQAFINNFAQTSGFDTTEFNNLLSSYQRIYV
ncbi:MAG: Fic family protein [Candidatus Heimdallarchaeota archaeon]|nr:Fic family protein [Candidatus Heimdallarchaeota archaeon]